MTTAKSPPSWSLSPNVAKIVRDFSQDAPGQNILDFDPQWVDCLSQAEQYELQAYLEALVGGERLEDQIVRLYPEEPPPRHVMPVIDAVEQARVTPIRVCFSIGPGHAKTTTLLRSIVWWLQKSPRDLCGYVTYSQAQANTKSRVAQGYAHSAGMKLASDAVQYWTTSEGGGLLAAGSRGQMTGQRIPGLLIYDDPYKDELEARSEAINSAVKERFKSVAFTRLQGGSIIVLHTRWAEDDLIGWLERDLKWDVININTQCDQLPDIFNRSVGEVAWPEKYPYEICATPCGHDGHLAEIRKTIGEHLWASMYQGRPRPLGKAIFHEPARYSRKDFSWTGKRGCIVIDPAATAKTSADYSVLLVCAMDGFGDKARMWIVDCVRLQCEIPELVDHARKLQLKYRLMVACEAIGGFKAVPQQLRRIDPSLRVMEITTGSKDKFTRAMPVSAAWNNDRVLVPEDAEWADEFIREHRLFTGSGDRHDDQVDADAHGWNVLFRNAPKITEKNYAQDGGM